MVKSEYDDGGLGEKLRVFAGGFLGDLVRDILANEIGEQMAADAQYRALTAFFNRTGRLINAINFIATEKGGALTTRGDLARSRAWYANPIEAGSTVEASGKVRRAAATGK